MTIESSSGGERSTSPRLSQPGLNSNDQVDDQEISDVLGTLHDHVDHDPSTNVLQNTSHRSVVEFLVFKFVPTSSNKMKYQALVMSSKL